MLAFDHRQARQGKIEGVLKLVRVTEKDVFLYFLVPATLYEWSDLLLCFAEW